LRTLTGHTGDVLKVAFSPDGKHLATASWDRTAKLWDVASGAELATFSDHSDQLWGVAFSPDGTKLATASADDTARLHPLNIVGLVNLARTRVTRQLTTAERQKFLHESGSE
jgi:WD40 repeat protein